MLKVKMCAMVTLHGVSSYTKRMVIALVWIYTVPGIPDDGGMTIPMVIHVT